MRPDVIVIASVGSKNSVQMRFTQNNEWSIHSRRIDPISRLWRTDYHIVNGFIQFCRNWQPRGSRWLPVLAMHGSLYAERHVDRAHGGRQFDPHALPGPARLRPE